MTITCENFRVQCFSFRTKFMKYLIKTANAVVMQKFHRCCKQFYKEAPYFIVDSIICDGYRRFENHQYDGCLISTDEDIRDKIKNIWVTKKAIFYACPSELLDKVIRCEAAEIDIYDVGPSYKTFKNLTKSGNVDTLKWDYINLPCGSIVPLEDILSLVPKATTVINDSYKCPVTPHTMEKLNLIQRKQPIKKFYISYLSGNLDAESFYEFVKVRHNFYHYHYCLPRLQKNMDPKADLYIAFGDDVVESDDDYNRDDVFDEIALIKRSQNFANIYNEMVELKRENLPKLNFVNQQIERKCKHSFGYVCFSLNISSSLVFSH